MQHLSPIEDIIRILPDLSAETVAAIIGAVAGSVISGVISFILHGQSIRAAEFAKEQEKREAQEALAYSVLLKSMQIASDFHRIKEEIDSLEFGFENGKNIEPWQIFQPTANIPPVTKFLDSEFAFVYKFNNSDVTNSILDLSRAHESLVQILEVYKVRGIELMDIIKPKVDETTYNIKMSKDDFLSNRYRMIELNHVFIDLLDIVDAECNRAKETFSRLADEINRAGILKRPFVFQFKG